MTHPHSPRRGAPGRRSALVAATAAGALLLGAAPAGAAGTASLRPSQIVAAAVATMRHASSFTISGRVTEGGKVVVLQTTATSSGDGYGTITLQGQPLHLIADHGTTYLRASAAFWQQADPAMAAKAGDWVAYGPGSGPSTSFAQFFSTRQLASTFTAKHNVWSRGGTATVRGQRALRINGRGPQGSGSLYVAASGTPYLLAEVAQGTGSGASGGTIYLSGYNRKVTVTPPPNPVTLPAAG